MSHMKPSERLAFAREWARVSIDELATAIETTVEVWRLAKRGGV